jgi:putative aldouronate transport system permease protein
VTNSSITKRFTNGMQYIWKLKTLYLMLIPGLICLIVFDYIPMYGVLIAFQNYKLGDVMGFSQWVGLKHFIDFFNSRDVFMILRNTVAMSILRLIIGFTAPIVLAILINECRNQKFKRTIQTISYLPHFISWVVVTTMVMQFLSPDGGAVNELLMGLGLIDTSIMFMGEPKYFWLIVVLSDVWKNVGWNSIIYLSAMASISPELYDAANIDGAGRLKKIWYITLPGIAPTITILLILQMGKLLNAGFEEIMLFTNDMNNTMVRSVAEVIDTYVLRYGIRQSRFSYATAVSFFRSVVSIILIWTSNFISRKVSDSSLF